MSETATSLHVPISVSVLLTTLEYFLIILANYKLVMTHNKFG
jgi:hypothetical protein